MRKIVARKGVYSLQGCPYWDETVITNHKIYFKHNISAEQKPSEKHKKEIYRGRSTIPPT